MQSSALKHTMAHEQGEPEDGLPTSVIPLQAGLTVEEEIAFRKEAAAAKRAQQQSAWHSAGGIFIIVNDHGVKFHFVFCSVVWVF